MVFESPCQNATVSEPKFITPSREIIDSSLVRRLPYRNISKRFDVSQTALSRHLNDHLADYVQQALREYGTSKGIKVLNKLGNIVERLEVFLDKAEADEDGLGFRATAAELRKQLELISKLQGELTQKGATTVNIALVEHPDSGASKSLSTAPLRTTLRRGGTWPRRSRNWNEDAATSLSFGPCSTL